MKTKKKILMLLMAMLAGKPTRSAQTMPIRGRNITLSTPYPLEIRNDSVFSYLPYYGRAYSVPYGGGSGLIFNAPLKEYTMDLDNKGKAVIK